MCVCVCVCDQHTRRVECGVCVCVCDQLTRRVECECVCVIRTRDEWSVCVSVCV